MKQKCLTFAILLLFAGIFAACARTQDAGLVAHYTFADGNNSIAKDVTGHGNDGKIGGATIERMKDGYALKLDGSEQSFIDFGDNRNLKMSKDMTFMAWVKLTAPAYPDSSRNWTIFSDEKYNESGSVLRMDGGDGYLMYRTNQPGLSNAMLGYNCLLNNVLYHIVLTVQGGKASVYVDGMLDSSGLVNDPVIQNTPFTISGFTGLIGDIRIYNRALQPDEVLARFKVDAPSRGKSLISARVFPQTTSGMIVAFANLRALGKTSPGAKIVGEISRSGHTEIALRKAFDFSSTTLPLRLTFDAIDLPKGDYTATFHLEGVQEAGASPVEETFTWPGADHGAVVARKAKVLNNLVMELLNIGAGSGNTWTFDVPYAGWVYIASKANPGANTRLTLDSAPVAQSVITYTSGSPETLETMRLLSAGKHTITAHGAPLQHLVVRSVPEIEFNMFGYTPPLPNAEKYDWPWLDKYVLKNINCMVGHVTPETDPYIKMWHDRGGTWIEEVPASPLSRSNANQDYDYITKQGGFTNPLTSGIMADEMGMGGDQPALDEAIRRISSDPRFKGKSFRPYAGASPEGSGGTSPVGSGVRFAKTLIDAKYPVLAERYFAEQPSLDAAQQYLNRNWDTDFARWQISNPGCMRQMVMAFGYFTTPWPALASNPQVDYKVWMDMQYQNLVTDPTFFGLYGVMEYTSGYADEEQQRWASALYRHYCIEGNTQLLSPKYGFKYMLDHVQNPDFVDGTNGWTVQSAANGSVSTKQLPVFSGMQERWTSKNEGEHFLWTKRQSDRPNMVSQTIKHLQPGKLYSLKMITGDYGDISTGKAVQSKHAVSINLSNVELIPEKSYQGIYISHAASNSNLYQNLHYRLFRAKSHTANLTISDWANDNTPGGPIGQELMYNFIEVQPYFEK